MRNRLNRKKNQILDLFDFYFSSCGHFCSKICQFLINSHDNLKNKNWKIDVSFVSAHCTSFMKVGSKLRRGGVCISLVGTEPYSAYMSSISDIHLSLSWLLRIGGVLACIVVMATDNDRWQQNKIFAYCSNNHWRNLEKNTILIDCLDVARNVRSRT